MNESSSDEPYLTEIEYVEYQFSNPLFDKRPAATISLVLPSPFSDRINAFCPSFPLLQENRLMGHLKKTILDTLEDYYHRGILEITKLDYQRAVALLKGEAKLN